MTLVEVMVVLVIIGLITTIVAVSVFNAIDTAKLEKARIEVGKLSETVESYAATRRGYPTTAEGLESLTVSPPGRPPPLEFLPADPWGNGYRYTYPSQQRDYGFDLWSAGPDGLDGTEDDIWRPGRR